jgi:hypothetical protein
MHLGAFVGRRQIEVLKIVDDLKIPLARQRHRRMSEASIERRSAKTIQLAQE